LEFDKNERWHRLLADPHLPEVGSVWTHPHGGLYTVMAVGFDESDGMARVAYRSHTHGSVQFRTLTNWLDGFHPAPR
jgi:hypothetical protein